jgi:hypothetical protein
VSVGGRTPRRWRLRPDERRGHAGGSGQVPVRERAAAATELEARAQAIRAAHAKNNPPQVRPEHVPHLSLDTEGYVLRSLTGGNWVLRILHSSSGEVSGKG